PTDTTNNTNKNINTSTEMNTNIPIPATTSTATISNPITNHTEKSTLARPSTPTNQITLATSIATSLNTTNSATTTSTNTNCKRPRNNILLLIIAPNKATKSAPSSIFRLFSNT
ncbi:3078_t:CDS:1, partial [Dentiscutata heterogama]